MKTSFSTTLLQEGNNTGIEVPESNIEELQQGKRPPVIVSVNGYTYPSTVAVMGGRSLIPFAKAHREASGIQGGDAIDVTLFLDTSPRTFSLPDDVAELVSKEDLQAQWEKLAPSRQKEYARKITDAKKPETRDNRVAKLIEDLRHSS